MPATACFAKQIRLYRSAGFAMKKRYCFPPLLFCLLACIQSTIAQTPLLERTISLQASSERLDEVLNKIAKQASLQFSYSPDVIQVNANVSLSVSNKSVREVLDQLFGGKVKYKTRGGYVILRRNEEKPQAQKKFMLTGYVIDSQTGRKVARASVYERESLASTVSNAYGFYQIRLPTDKTELTVTVGKQNYRSQRVAVKPRQKNALNIAITPVEIEKIAALPIRTTDSVKGIDNSAIAKMLVNDAQKTHIINVTETLRRRGQLSLFPFLGTNHLLSGNVTNDYSVNLFAGYSAGTRKLELGGFANLNRGDASGWQLAGFTNLVGGNSNAVQLAGFGNAVRNNAAKPQLAGFFNFNRGDARHFQAAGFVNVNLGGMEGVQAAGFVNLNRKNLNGMQLAGFHNQQIDSITGLQAAGFSNSTLRRHRGVQLAGFANYAGKLDRGAQVAGFANVALHTMRGLQLSGFINYAGTVEKGLQLGVFNYADSSHGVPVGFLSFVRKNGYRRLELSADETTPVNVAFKTGVRRLYNIFFVGLQPFGSRGFATWRYGYGVGTAFRLGSKWQFNMDYVGTFVSTEPFAFTRHSLHKLHFLFERALTPNVALAFGPTFNVFLTDSRSADHTALTALPPYTIWDAEAGSKQAQSWVGFQAALRFFDRKGRG